MDQNTSSIHQTCYI